MRRLGNPMIGLRTVYEGGVVAGLTDAQLLERFARGDGEGASSAFAVLVERHGPMVLRVCRASIGDEHDAEDAFQAVFLVLARKAKSVWVRDSLGPWLHAVALRTATRLRRQIERRKRLEHRLAIETAGDDDGRRKIDADLVQTIHEEVGRLPDRFREAVVLCDLEGCSHEEAAGRLNWPVGTVKSRQARGRERLRARLSRRGLAPADYAVAAALRSCPVPADLIHATVRAGAGLRDGAAAAGTVSAAAALARDVSGALTMSALKSGVMVVLVCGAVVAGGVSITRAMRAEEAREGRRGPDGPPAAPVPAGPRPPAGSLFAMRFAADPKHDGEAAGPVYQWVKLDPGSRSWMDGLITRNEGDDVMVALKPDPQNLTERDLLEVDKTTNERGFSAIEFRLTPDGSRRFGELTRAHLPEDGGLFRYRLALIVENVVVALPTVLTEIRDAGVIEPGTQTTPGEVDRLIKLLAGAAAYNNLPTARAVKDRAEAVREAKAVDLPALAGADRVVVEPIPKGYRRALRNPRDVQNLIRALRPTEKPAEGGDLAATLWFYRGDDLLKKVWVREGGEWGFERPVASWTTGADPDLWRLVKVRTGRTASIWDRLRDLIH